VTGAARGIAFHRYADADLTFLFSIAALEAIISYLFLKLISHLVSKLIMILPLLSFIAALEAKKKEYEEKRDKAAAEPPSEDEPEPEEAAAETAEAADGDKEVGRCTLSCLWLCSASCLPLSVCNCCACG
jgi:hypothetical protein